MFIASGTLLVSFAAQGAAPGPDAITMLVCIWAIAASEVIVFVTFYLCMKMRGSDMDLSKLSQTK